ncbi:MAG: sulfurtransferase TusA family protein [gamma proteobacterium symbiont of Lucinoma myriamae]|nr:sulfurtransferase TusA family protein [gamma proteobacterium symbiont of Lucinoma myriamae]MCU7818327.1 sulfurtransferase TusA family protein [gamma proteobacterium symbiont of Lucinoma myriamae]MCU7832044.1 sulfurtransferase TusA family protein [gamma proteobacterium symbiont of Lucinoma myriamae]
MTEHQLDARRLLCPLPVIRTQDAVNKLHSGDLLTVTSTDPGAKMDIPAWCRINGHEVTEIKEQDHEIIITIRVINQD